MSEYDALESQRLGDIDTEHRAQQPCSLVGLIALWSLGIGALLPLFLFCVCGLAQLAQWSISPEMVTILVSPKTQMPFYFKILSAFIGTLIGALVLGPPELKRKEVTDPIGKLKAAAKTVYTVYLLAAFLLEAFNDYQQVWQHVAKLPEYEKITVDLQSAPWQVFPFAVKTLEIWAVKFGCGRNISSVVDMITLAFVYHDRLNFLGAHNRSVVEKWRRGCRRLDDLDPYCPTVAAPSRISRLVSDMVAANGRAFAAYILCMLILYLPFTFFWGVWGLVCLVIFYFWVFAVLFVVTRQGKKLVVVPFLRAVVREGASETHDMVAGNQKYCEGEEEELRHALDMIASASVAPARIERRTGILFIGTKTTKELTEPSALFAEYRAHLDTIFSSGVSRDGWCYILTVNVALKFGFDLVPVILIRFASGHGYFASVTTTLSERHFVTYIGQFQQPLTAVWDFLGRTT